MKTFLINSLFHAAYVVLFCLWQFKGHEGAGNVLVVWFWLLTLILFVAPFGYGKADEETLTRHPVGVAYSWLWTFVQFSALAWVGNIWLAALYLTASFVCYAARVGALDKKRKARREARATESEHWD